MNTQVFKQICRYFLCHIACLTLALSVSYAQNDKGIQVHVVPDHPDWIYKKGEAALFSVSVTRNDSVLKNVPVRYEIGPEKMPASKSGNLTLGDGKVVINAGELKEPGFLRCVVTAELSGQKYTGTATAAFDPAAIRPTAVTPADFLDFWNNAKKEAAKIPLDAKMILIPERSTETVNVYHISVQNDQLGSRIYGIACIPKKEGKYPAILRVPGAGIRPYAGNIEMAKKGIITLDIGVHGIPVNLDGEVYSSLAAGALKGYQLFNLENRDKYYFKRVYLGCVRAIDFIYSLPQFDGKNMAVWGSSQGGALSIVTTALDERVKYLGVLYPALCDLTGYLHNRAGGWPHMFSKANAVNITKEKIATSGYYDVVNFARLIKVPGLYSWGFNDETTPPTSIYAAYNLITAPKQLFLIPEAGHKIFPEQGKRMNEWLESNLKAGK